MWLLAINNFYVHSPTYIRMYICTYLCTVYYYRACLYLCLYFCNYQPDCMHDWKSPVFACMYSRSSLMGMRVRSQRKANKRCVCVWVGGGAQHSYRVVNCACPCMAASVESRQFPIDCLCVPCTHTCTYVHTGNGKISRFKTGWLLGL